METSPVPAPAVPVTYEAGRDYNRDLAGKGMFTVRDGQFVFTGRSRRLLLTGPETELVIAPDQITNVGVLGVRVEFVTTAGKSGEKKVPFVFFCETPADAVMAAAALPGTKDEAFTAAERFQRNLVAVAQAEPGACVTHWLIGACVVMYAVLGFLGAGWFETASRQPYFEFAASNGAATRTEWWRLVTSMFAHYGLMHLLLNMWALYQVGALVERLLGRAGFTVMYLGSGLLAGLTSMLWNGDKVWSAGASGAVFGVYGALLGYLWREKRTVPAAILQPLLKSTLLFAGYNLLFGAVHPHIDNAAHIGGFVAGVVLGALAALPLELEARRSVRTRRLGLAVAVVLVGIAIGVGASPRFDYNVRDELAWKAVQRRHAPRERTLAEAGDKLMSNARTNARDPALQAWLREQAIPFYQGWRDELARLPLRANLLTARRREALVQILDAKLASFRQLTEPRVTDFAAFNEQRKATSAMIDAYRKLPLPPW